MKADVTGPIYYHLYKHSTRPNIAVEYKNTQEMYVTMWLASFLEDRAGVETMWFLTAFATEAPDLANEHLLTTLHKKYVESTSSKNTYIHLSTKNMNKHLQLLHKWTPLRSLVLTFLGQIPSKSAAACSSVRAAPLISRPQLKRHNRLRVAWGEPARLGWVIETQKFSGILFPKNPPKRKWGFRQNQIILGKQRELFGLLGHKDCCDLKTK